MSQTGLVSPAPGAEAAGDWGVVLGAFLVTLVGFGAAYSFAAFAPALEQEFAVPRAAANLLYSVSGGLAFMVSAAGGLVADRAGPRRVAASGIILVALGLLLAAAARSFAELLACYGVLIGLGIGLSYVPSVAAVQRRFAASRGLATGLAASGIGVGTILAPPAAGLLLSSYGWREAFVIFGTAAGIIGLCGAWLLASPHAAAAERRTAASRSVFRQPDYWRLYAGCFLVSIPISLPFVHLVRFAVDHGSLQIDALWLLSIVGVGSTGGRFLLGGLADRWGRRRSLVGCCLGVAFATLGWAGSSGLLGLSLFALVFGLLYGGFVALLPAFTTDTFGRAQIGSALGVLYTGRGLALLIGPSLELLWPPAAQSGPWPLIVAGFLGILGSLIVVKIRGQPAESR